MKTEAAEDEDAWDNGLKHKERLFCLHYCTDEKTFLNAKESYRAVYTRRNRETGEVIEPAEQTCEVNSSRLCKKPRIKMAIRRLLKLSQGELDETNTYKIINNLANLAFFNPADILKANGKLKVRDLSELGEKAKAIAQIKTTLTGPQVTLVDRSKYMDLMMKYLNIVRPEQQIEIKLPVIEITPKEQSVEEWNAKAQE